MKGLILSGGKGTRLRPITHTSAKQLVPVANKPILFYGIEDMAEAGITEVGLIVGETAEEVRAAVGDGSRWGVEITYLPQDEPLGLAHCVAIARDFLGDDDFVMYLGDNLLQQGLTGLVERFDRDRLAAAAPSLEHAPPSPSAHILLCAVPDPQRFGVAELDGDRIVRLVEKPVEPPSDLAMVGVYLFTPAIHEAVAAISPSARGELEIVDAIQWLIDRGHAVHHEQISGWWLDTGKKDSLLEANRRALESIEPRIDGTVDASSEVDGRVVVEAGAVLEGSTVRGPAIIGAGARITGSYIGPFTSVGEDATITGSEVENSVLLERVRLDGVPRLVDSLIGRDTEVARSGRPPKATRLLLGDHCSVDLQ
ncbi:glucose-1-phosphate thymidylyltransferase [Aquihabitans sp. G128]|uniref:glucose-1-phosphate thymidylyltransferase n=1 Tax=Aquihabitans sp. G128 TaxID=2849779 RepID=UPI001C221908|nr:glucose-1-phosphate thymidylyltransferase [Aquihabitans sp. G128]QXC61481.1 glucose-1-phosphate thymidylyltransferase [Aquihabitans sp. G128]